MSSSDSDRSYSNLKEGENYRNVKPTHHIGILDFNLKGLTPQFYSHFKLLNAENHEIYSSDIELSVLNLKQIDKATDSDRARKLDVFAKVFKAETQWYVSTIITIIPCLNSHLLR